MSATRDLAARPPMTVTEIQRRREIVKGYWTGRIESNESRDVAYRQALDHLQRDVLQAIADGAGNPGGLARAVLVPIEVAGDEWE